MKKIVFTLMVFALVVFTNNAKAQVTPGTNKYPFEGSTYSYILTGIEVKADGYAVIEYLSGSGATITNVEGSGEDYTGTNIPITVTASPYELNFDIAYADGATDGILKVTVTDGDGCTNYIQMAIDVQTAPTLVMKVEASSFTCSNLNGSPADNTDATVGAAQNSFTYTITPTVSITSDYTYSYDFDITPATSGLTSFSVTRTTGDGSLSGNYANGFSVTGATTATQVFTVTFNTTEAVATADYVGTIDETTNIPKLTVATTSGDGIYDGTVSANDATVQIKTTPKIGSFTIE